MEAEICREALEQAIRSGEEAMALLEQILRHLKKAELWGTLGLTLVTHGLPRGVIKRRRLRAVLELKGPCYDAIKGFRENIKELPVSKISIPTAEAFVNVCNPDWTDTLVDYTILRQISKAIVQVDRLHAEIQKRVEKLKAIAGA